MSGAISIDEFITGAMSALKLSGVESVPVKGVEAQFVRVFRMLERWSEPQFLELRFHCQWNATTRQCPVIRHALLKAEQESMISRDGHSWAIHLTPAQASANIEQSPLSLEEWKSLTAHMRTAVRFVPLVP